MPVGILGGLGGQKLLATVPLTAATTSGIIALPPGYTEARIVICGTGGGSAGNPVVMMMNNDSTAANYIYDVQYALFSTPTTLGGTSSRGATTPTAGGMIGIFASPPTALDIDVNFGLLKANGRACVKGKFVALAALDANMNRGDVSFVYDQTAADISSCTVNFGGAFTGTVRAYVQ